MSYLEKLSDEARKRKSDMPTWLAGVAEAQKLSAVERLVNGGQLDLAALVDTEIRTAYAEGRKDERENLERIGAVADCPGCGGRGERMVASGYGPDVYQELVDCHDCHGTGYARVRPA